MISSSLRGVIHPLGFWFGMAALFSLFPPTAEAQPPARNVDTRRLPWRAFGKVTDQEGKPFAGVEVRAY